MNHERAAQPSLARATPDNLCGSPQSERQATAALCPRIGADRNFPA